MTPSDRLTFEKVGHLTKCTDRSLQGVPVWGLSVALFSPAGRIIKMMGVRAPSISQGFPSLHIHGCLGQSWTLHGLHSSLPRPFTTPCPNSSCKSKVDTDFVSLLSFIQMGPVTPATSQIFAWLASSCPSAALQISVPQRLRL